MVIKPDLEWISHNICCCRAKLKVNLSIPPKKALQLFCYQMINRFYEIINLCKNLRSSSSNLSTKMFKFKTKMKQSFMWNAPLCAFKQKIVCVKSWNGFIVRGHEQKGLKTSHHIQFTSHNSLLSTAFHAWLLNRISRLRRSLPAATNEAENWELISYWEEKTTPS